MAPESKRRMPSKEQIEAFFRKLGLESEKDRQRFIRLRQLADSRAASKARGVQKTTTDNTQSEAQDAELERNLKRS